MQRGTLTLNDLLPSCMKDFFLDDFVPLTLKHGKNKTKRKGKRKRPTQQRKSSLVSKPSLTTLVGEQGEESPSQKRDEVPHPPACCEHTSFPRPAQHQSH